MDVSNIRKEVKTDNPLYCATLDNGTKINVYGDYAKGFDGRTYYHVGKEDTDGVLFTVGWSCDADSAVVIE